MADLKLKSIQPLFFSPLSIYEIANAPQLNHQLSLEAAAMRAASPGMQRTNIDGWHSDYDLFERKEPGCRALCKHILDAVEQVTRAVSPQLDLNGVKIDAEGWINILAPGGLNAPHDHPGWMWSGCYYVNVPEGESDLSGSIEFFDSRTNMRTHTVEGAACFSSKYSVKPRAGMMLLFPAYLKHWVYPNKSGKERMSVAFNARLVPPGLKP